MAFDSPLRNENCYWDQKKFYSFYSFILSPHSKLATDIFAMSNRILQGATSGESKAAFNARRQSTISQAYTQSEYSESEFGEQGIHISIRSSLQSGGVIIQPI